MTRKRLSARERERCFDSTGGICHLCRRPILPGDAWEASHEIPLAIGGEDTPENRMPAHKHCHARRTALVDKPRIAKTKRQRQKHIGAKPKSQRGFRGWRRFSGEIIWKEDRR
jgi:5-methylcytosine-specific restriction enzyme A